MSAFTKLLGFNKYGGKAAGAASDDNYKFSTVDRDYMDRLCQAIETHTHVPSAPLPDPSDLPTVAVRTDGGGSMAGGLDLTYVITYVDWFGNETGRSATAEVSTPGVGAPSAPTGVGVAGGGFASLAAGSYTYYITELNDGIESRASAPCVVNVALGQNSVTLTFTDTGSKNLYRQGPGDSYPYMIDQISGTSVPTTYSDLGGQGIHYDPYTMLPSDNTPRAGNYSVTINIPAADSDIVKAAQAWRVYRSNDDTFSSPSLVATISTRDGSNDLYTSFIDVGLSPFPGLPPYVSQCISFAQVTPPPIYLVPTSDGHLFQIDVTDGVLGTTAADGPELVLTAPNGDFYKLACLDDGTLTTIRCAYDGTDGTTVYTRPDGSTFTAGIGGTDPAGGADTPYTGANSGTGPTAPVGWTPATGS